MRRARNKSGPGMELKSEIESPYARNRNSFYWRLSVTWFGASLVSSIQMPRQHIRRICPFSASIGSENRSKISNKSVATGIQVQQFKHMQKCYAPLALRTNHTYAAPAQRHKCFWFHKNYHRPNDVYRQFARAGQMFQVTYGKNHSHRRRHQMNTKQMCG